MNGQIVVTGANILRDPSVNTNSSGGNDGQGTIRIQSGQQVFDSDDIVVFDVQNVTADGEVSGASGFFGITVYDSAADFASGTTKFTYGPQNPGQTANVQSDLSGLGDGYVRFNANVLVSSDPGAPTFNQLIVAGGRDLVSEIASGPVLFDRNQDFDFDGDGMIDVGTIEEGNNLYALGTGVMICFAEGAPILTPDGYKPVEALEVGDRVVTRDHGAQRILWIGAREVAGTGDLTPIRFAPGAIGNTWAFRVSPNHRILVSGPSAELMAGLPEVLAPAKHLVNDTTIRPAPCAAVTYHHFLCESHEIVDVAGCLAETLHPGAEALDMMGEAARAEVLALFPELETAEARPLARPALRAGQAAVLKL
ncbi:Hint domain-containing protein [Jannaschia marina]|uniref:Hint domain-containing protein n=1 Tax=Jannaschia marina TaxID=2741674 RepID=UPI0015CA3404|nr:Hint domain-containing protein [Jannaschia marina]